MDILLAARKMINAHNDLQDTLHKMWSDQNLMLASKGIITWKEFWNREDNLWKQKKYMHLSDIVSFK